MQIARIWSSLVLVHVSELLLVGCQYVGPFSGQRSVALLGAGQQWPRQQQPQRSRESREAALSGKRATTLAEPSCEELRAMWRYSKRQSRAAENTNELPTFRDPFTYNIWEAYPSGGGSSSNSYREYAGPARSRSGGSPIYGKLVHKAPAGSRLRNGMPDRTRAFEEVARLYGTVNRQPPSQRRKAASFRVGGGGGALNSGANQIGSFQHLKELIISERAKELQEQRRAEEIAERAAALKEMTSSEGLRAPGSGHDLRRGNFLGSQFAEDELGIGRAFQEAGREFALR